MCEWKIKNTKVESKIDENENKIRCESQLQ